MPNYSHDEGYESASINDRPTSLPELHAATDSFEDIPITQQRITRSSAKFHELHTVQDSNVPAIQQQDLANAGIAQCDIIHEKLEVKKEENEEVDIDIHLSKCRPVFLGYDHVEKELTLTHDMGSYTRFIALDLRRYVKLISCRKEIDAMVAKVNGNGRTQVEFKKHIGGNIYVSINNKYHVVDIRQFIFIDSELIPTRAGVALHFVEWLLFKETYKHLAEVLPEILQIRPCSETHDPENEDEALTCKECFPC